MSAPSGAPAVRKMGVLTKLGGGEGGRKSWKDRFFVLTDHLAYYKNEEAYLQGKDPLNTILLNSYYVARNDESKKFEFTVHAYPKSLTCQAASEEDLQSWLDILLEPMREYMLSAS